MNELLLHGLLAFFAGITLNLMPCVLPVMPFKIQAVRREINTDLSSRILAAAALLAGTLGFFLIIGLASVYLGLIWGELFQSKLFLGGLSLFLLLAGAATFLDRPGLLFGLWSGTLPGFLFKIPAKKYWRAALTGALAGVLSTPCSGPFLGSVLAFSLTRTPVEAILLFLSIGIGLSFPYMVLLIWPGLSDWLRFSGEWTARIKDLFGFILISGAVFFSQSLLPKNLTMVVWIVLIAGFFLWGTILILRFRAWPYRVAGFITIGLLLLSAIAHEKGVQYAQNRLDWQPFTEAAINKAIENEHPVMIEFTADWCLNCKVLEKTVLKSEKVISAVKETALVPLRVDITKVSKENKSLLSRYKGNALPYLVILDKKGIIVERFTGVFKPNTLVNAILKTGETS